MTFIRDKNNRRCGRNWFDIAATGDYWKDTIIGKESAAMFIKALRDDEGNEYNPPVLQSLVLQILENEGITAPGQFGAIVGFFLHLEYYLRYAAKYGCKKLDGYPYDHFIDAIEKARQEGGE